MRVSEYFSDDQVLNFRRLDPQLRFDDKAVEKYAVDKWA